jgi:ferric-dicitrate binding protein FerR (iron transport regulator)
LEQELNYNELINTFLSGNCTSNEKKQLKNWIKESKANENYFEHKKLTWYSCIQEDLNIRFSSKAALEKVHNTIRKENSHYKITNTKSTRLLPFNNLLRIAAIVLIAFLTGGITAYLLVKNNNAGNICYLEAPLGSRVSAGLPDGTQVWLNAGSKLEYTTNYNRKNREVRLTGEGYFKVKTNANKPFIVRTKEISIKAIGTAFNVKAYPDEKQVTTTLVEGKVKLEGIGENNKKFSYSLIPKQKATYYKDITLFDAVQKNAEKPKVTKKKEIEKEIIPLKEVAPIVSNIDVNTELYTSWKDERWIIESENLDDLAILLERRFNVKLWFKNNELKKYRFSGTIQNETLEQIFDIMRLTLPVTYFIDKGNVTIDMDKSLKNKYRAAYLN